MIPEWFNEWVEFEVDNWHLKPGAPENIQREFKEWMEKHNKPDRDVD